MALFTAKQQQIYQRQVEVIQNFPTLWSQMMTEWHQPGLEDRAWLMYSANYLFRTKDIRWAMDPVRLKHRLPKAPDVDMVRDLCDLNFVLLTHRHADHLDLGLLRQLKDFPIFWVVPAHILDVVLAGVEIPADRLIVPEALKPIEIQGIGITPFEGQHWEKQPGTELPRGVPATGYLVEFNGKRWLFPGDTRTYDASRLPAFGAVDGLFAHLWLGRGCANMEHPPLLDAFCQFCLDLHPKKVVLTHLEEFGRDADDYWDQGHAQRVRSCLREKTREIEISVARLGESVLL
jgi:L-ascorbate metabolism protein UlaG (beta-lactamase superfamily)